MGISRKKFKAIFGNGDYSAAAKKIAKTREDAAAEVSASNEEAQRAKGLNFDSVINAAKDTGTGLVEGLWKGGAQAVGSLASLASSAISGDKENDVTKESKKWQQSAEDWGKKNNSNDVGEFIGSLPGGIVSGITDEVSNPVRGLHNLPEGIAADIAAGSKDRFIREEGIKKQKELQEKMYGKDVAQRGDLAMTMAQVADTGGGIVDLATAGLGGKAAKEGVELASKKAFGKAIDEVAERGVGQVAKNAAQNVVKQGTKQVLKTALKEGTINAATGTPLAIMGEISRGEEITPESVVKDAAMQFIPGALISGVNKAKSNKKTNANIDAGSAFAEQMDAAEASRKAKSAEADALKQADSDKLDSVQKEIDDNNAYVDSKANTLIGENRLLPEGTRTLRTPDEVSSELNEVQTGTGKYANATSEQRKSAFSSLTRELEVSTKNSETKDFVMQNDTKTNTSEPIENIDNQLKAIGDGKLPDDVTVEHPTVNNAAEIAFSESLPDNVKETATTLLDHIGAAYRKLKSLMTKENSDEAHKSMDQAYNDRLEQINQMPEPRQEVEIQKLNEQYTKDLDDLTQRIEADKPEVEKFTTIKDYLTAKQDKLVTDVNNKLKENPGYFKVADQTKLSEKVTELEHAKKIKELTKPNSDTNSQLVASVENGLKPSESKNPRTKKALNDSKVEYANTYGESNSKNPGLVANFTGTPSEVLKEFGGPGPRISEILDNASDKIAIEDNKMSNNIVSWAKNAGGVKKLKDIAKALDGDFDALSSLSDRQRNVYNQVKDMFKKYADAQGIPENARIQDYLPHLFNGKSIEDVDAAIAQLKLGKRLDGKILTIEDTKKFNKTLAGLDYETIQMIKNNSIYNVSKNGFLEKRTNVAGYSFNLPEIIHAYTHAAHNALYLKPAFDEAKILSKDLSYAQNTYLAKVVKSIGGKPDDEIGSMLNASLENLWKGESNLYNRASSSLRHMIYNGTMGFNVGASLKNLGQGSNTYAKLGAPNYFHGLKNALMSFGKDNLLYQEALDSGVLTNKYSDFLKKGDEASLLKHKVDSAMWSLFSGTEQINRLTAYYGGKEKFIKNYIKEQSKLGNKIDIDKIPDDIMSSAKKAGREMSKETQFEFGAMDVPVGWQSTTAKNLLQFQSYNLAQVNFIKKMVVGDTDSLFVKNESGKGYHVSSKGTLQMARYLGAQTLFISTVGAALGMDMTDIVPYLSNITDQQIPESPMTKLITGDTSSAGLTTIAGDVVSGNFDEVGNDVKSLGTTAAGLFIPGGSQAKKTLQAMNTNAKGYSENAAGNVKFKQDQDTVSQVRSNIFGQYTTEAGKEWLKKGRENFSKAQTSDIYSQDTEAKKQRVYDFYNTFKQVENKRTSKPKIKEMMVNRPNHAETMIQDNNDKVNKLISEYQSKYGTITDEEDAYIRKNYLYTNKNVETLNEEE